MKITNAEVRTKTGSTRVSEQVKIRRWQWLGHVLRMEPDSLPRTAITWAPEGKRKRGRPKETWRRTVERERREMGFETWREAEQAAKDRRRWRDLIKGSILSSQELGHKKKKKSCMLMKQIANIDVNKDSSIN